MADVDRRPRVADEDDLCRLWAARAFPAEALVTTAGERVQVIYPGRRSGGGGPDFQGAILSDAAGRLRAGDVEVHLRSGDWVAHGHRADPAYNGVILHVVLEDDGSACLRADGRSIPVLALAAWVTAPLAHAAADLAPLRACRVSPALLTQDVCAIIRRAGHARLEGKAMALEAQIAALGPQQALFAALLDAAGYSRNRVPCAHLAERLPVERLYDLLAGKSAARRENIASAILLGLAGLLRPDTDRALWTTWLDYAELWPLPPLHPDSWVRAGVRPANHPALRLAGLAALLARYTAEGLVAALLAPLRARDAARLVAALEVPAGSAGRTPPIGPGRAAEMAVNVVAPFALALARSDGDDALEAAAWQTVAELPAGEDTEPLRQMRALLAASGHRLRAPGALEQQGLLHLYRSGCAVHACWECPLASGAS